MKRKLSFRSFKTLKEIVTHVADYVSRDLTIWTGRSSQQNWELISRNSPPSELFGRFSLLSNETRSDQSKSVSGTAQNENVPINGDSNVIFLLSLSVSGLTNSIQGFWGSLKHSQLRNFLLKKIISWILFCKRKFSAMEKPIFKNMNVQPCTLNILSKH